jgi:hypothetical protein
MDDTVETDADADEGLWTEDQAAAYASIHKALSAPSRRDRSGVHPRY